MFFKGLSVPRSGLRPESASLKGATLPVLRFRQKNKVK